MLVPSEEWFSGEYHLLPQPVPFCPVGHAYRHGVLAVAELDVRPWSGPEVAEPLRFRLGPTARPRDEVSTDMFQEGDGGGTRETAAAAGHGEQHDR